MSSVMRAGSSRAVVANLVGLVTLLGETVISESSSSPCFFFDNDGVMMVSLVPWDVSDLELVSVTPALVVTLGLSPLRS